MAAWPFLVVIDLDEVTVRCRLCRWTSPTQATVEQARLAYAAHACTDRSTRGPFLGWCAICGRVRVRGLRPAGPSRPRAWIHTWVCANGCPSKAISVVGDLAGAWDARPCPQAPARHPEQPGGPA
jgi:Pyruvate/2-oxoacid:ferredoxin oxidoreductase delta subunit